MAKPSSHSFPGQRVKIMAMRSRSHPCRQQPPRSTFACLCLAQSRSHGMACCCDQDDLLLTYAALFHA